MRRILAACLSPLAAIALLAFPVAAETEDATDPCRPLSEDGAEESDPLVCEVRYYLSCDTAFAGKVNHFLSVVGANAVFTEEPPAGSFTAGEGCGEVENSNSRGVQQNNVHDFTFEGYADGNIDSITVELHDFAFSPERSSDEIELGMRLTIEDVSPFGTMSGEAATGAYTAPAFVPVKVQPEASDTGLTVAYRFTITGLDAILGTAGEPGAGRFDHFVKMTIDTPLDGAHAFVWGADEVPSGITINPVEHEATVIEATG